jgi:hypothetical protein
MSASNNPKFPSLPEESPNAGDGAKQNSSRDDLGKLEIIHSSGHEVHNNDKLPEELPSLSLTGKQAPPHHPANMESTSEPKPTDDTHSQPNLTPEDFQKLSVSSPQFPEPSDDHKHLDVPPPPPEKDELYIDPTPKTPQAPRSPAPVPAEFSEKELPDVPKAEEHDGISGNGPEGRRSEDSQSEIQSIMEQFSSEAKGPNKDEIMSPRLELAEQFLVPQGPFPPRRSSLEPLNTSDHPPSVAQSSGGHHVPSPVLSSKPSPYPTVADGSLTPRSSVSLTGPPPPEPEPDQTFDFHRFLEQLRHRTADPVAKFLRSFLTEFGKKQWMAHEQVKIISDFLAFITNKMAQCEVWRHVSDAEFDNAKEGMEKLVMNRLYSQTFSPAITPPPTLPRSASKSKRRELERLHGPGRRGQHQEDVERDDILAQKIRIYSWIREEHLDIPPVGNSGRRFLLLAQQGKFVGSTSSLGFITKADNSIRSF